MHIHTKRRRLFWWPSILLLAALIVAACSGFEPYEPRNDREEGPESGLFTGPGGEWVIFGKKKSDEKEEKKEDSDESTQNKQE